MASGGRAVPRRVRKLEHFRRTLAAAEGEETTREGRGREKKK